MSGVRWVDVGYFGAELAVYGAVVSWALTRDVPGVLRWVFAAAGFLILAASWGMLAAPRAAFPLTDAADVAFRCAWFGVGAIAGTVVVMEAVAR